MTAAATPLTDGSALCGRRLIARIVDDTIVLAFAVGLLAAVGTYVDTPGAPVLQLLDLSPSDYGYPNVDESAPSAAVLIAVALLLIGTLSFYVGVSAAGGRSPGRALAGVTVVRADGRAVTWSALLGRELLRNALLALAVALVWPAATLLATASSQVTHGDTAVLIPSVLIWMPFPLVAAAWIGSTLVDPLGRAPHDRLAGTLVVATDRRAPDDAS